MTRSSVLRAAKIRETASGTVFGPTQSALRDLWRTGVNLRELRQQTDTVGLRSVRLRSDQGLAALR